MGQQQRKRIDLATSSNGLGKQAMSGKEKTNLYTRGARHGIRLSRPVASGGAGLRSHPSTDQPGAVLWCMQLSDM
jgi:hypothetical protein